MSQSEGEKKWRPVNNALFYAKVGFACLTLLWLKLGALCEVCQAVLRDNFWANSYHLKARMKCFAFYSAVVLFAVFMAYTSATTTTMMVSSSTYDMMMPSASSNTSVAASASSVGHMMTETTTSKPTSSAVNFAPSVLAMAVALLFATLK